MKMFEKRIMLPFLMVLLSMFFLAGCNSDSDTTGSENDDGENEEAVFPVEIAEVEEGILSNDLSLSGTVMAERLMPVMPMLSGEVTAVHVENGEKVEKGDVLLELDASDIELNISQAQAGLDAAEANLRSAKSMREQGMKQAEMQLDQAKSAYEMISNAEVDEALDLENIPEELQGVIESLMMSNMPTEQDKAQAEAAVTQAEMALEQATSTAQIDAAEASVKQAEIALEMAEKQQNQAVITAPISGKITNFSTEVGEMIAPQAPLLQVVKMDEPIVSVQVNESMLPNMDVGQEVDIYVPSFDKTYEGRITHISIMPGEQSRAYPVEIIFSNPDENLRIGMLASVMLQTGVSEETVLAPVRAVSEENGENYVYVTTDGERVKRRVITIGNETSEFFEVTSGLDKGEFIVINGTHQLHDGALINVRNGDNYHFSN